MKRDCECGTPASRLESVFSEGEVDFRRCPTCGLVFREVFPTLNELDEIYRQAYETEKIATGFTNQESGSYAAQKYADFIEKHLVSNPRREKHILDFGAGSGQLVDLLRQRHLQADGMEFAAQARQFCLSKRGFNLIPDISGVPTGQYAFVSMIEVIEHLTELDGTLAELWRVLAPGGILLITTPNRLGFRARIEGGNWREATKKFHLCFFDRKSLQFHLHRAGFVQAKQILFSPVQRPGCKSWLTARLTQSVGLGGTLCMIATKPRDTH